MDITTFTSPFCGQWPMSQTDMLELLKISNIEDQPVQSVTIFMKNDDESFVIEAGNGRHYGAAFFAHCARRYGPIDGASMFPITFPMIVEAILYYGPLLWNDTANDHPAIIPFRRALAGESIGFMVQYKDTMSQQQGETK